MCLCRLVSSGAISNLALSGQVLIPHVAQDHLEIVLAISRLPCKMASKMRGAHSSARRQHACSMQKGLKRLIGSDSFRNFWPFIVLFVWPNPKMMYLG